MAAMKTRCATVTLAWFCLAATCAAAGKASRPAPPRDGGMPAGPGDHSLIEVRHGVSRRGAAGVAQAVATNWTCKSWCATHNQGWAVVCGWADCGGCDYCSLPENRCPAPTGITNVALQGACQEGEASIVLGRTCQAACAIGYSPSAKSLKCGAGGLFSPPNFTCQGHQCRAPGYISNRPPNTTSCVEGSRVDSGSACTPQCKEGYTPSAPSLSCEGGVLYPPTYVCQPDPCAAPADVPNAAAAASCSEGASVESGTSCTAACAEGFWPSTPSLQCKAGVLSPASFQCEPAWASEGTGGWCAQVDNSYKGTRTGPKNEAQCQAKCEDDERCNYFCYGETQLAEARCKLFKKCFGMNGTSPQGNDVSGYSCFHSPQVASCASPPASGEVSSDPHLICSGRKLELDVGGSVQHGEECTAHCAAGYSPSESKLACGLAGVLAPANFSCQGNPCKAPKGIDNDHIHGPCAEGSLLDHGGKCTAQCLEGYSPSVSSLACVLGELTPQTFACAPSTCQAPSGIANAADGGTCREATSLDSGSSCTPACAPGFWPSQVTLTCSKGALSPPTYTCESAPVWQVEEKLCKQKCPDSACESGCYRMWVPTPVRILYSECSNQCNVDHFLDVDSEQRSQCRSLCRPQFQVAYEQGELFGIPEWRLNYTDCTEQVVYTGAQPEERKGLPGCRWIEDKVEAGRCYSQCMSAVPSKAKVYRTECQDTCDAADPEGDTEEAARKTGGCRNLCWRDAASRMIREDEAQAMLGSGDGSTGGVSSAALTALAERVLGIERELVRTRDTMVSDVRQAVTGLMHAQWAAEETARQAGGSGITKARVYQGGSQPYHTGSYTTPAMASSHNHANGYRTVGLGEFAAIVNGVSFRTRHNDYSLKMPSTTSDAYHATEDVPRPEVPPSVLAKGTPQEQIYEMREYFKAFKEQNVSHRDYRQYFRPTLCYLETAWERLTGDELVEPFESDRHHVAATGWKDLVDKTRFYDLSGGKDSLENIPWLPTSVMDMDIAEGRLVPRLAKWSYRILCHPVDGDVETARIRAVRDSHVQLQRARRFASEEDAFYARDARFQVDPRLSLHKVKTEPQGETVMGRSYLDLLMEQIPGKNNYGSVLKDDILHPTTSRLEPYAENDTARAAHGTAVNGQHTIGDLNTAYYSRYFGGSLDAMGRASYKRGFNDPSLWAAMTTHRQIANASMIKTGSSIKPGQVCLQADGTTCPRISQRWTYAIPVELIYLTPLFNWNPYGIPTLSKGEQPEGKGQADDPFSAAEEGSMFYRTPAAFYGSCSAGVDETPDSADTDRDAVHVKDDSGTPQQVVGSGQSIVTRCIPGAGKVRLRYNIMPVHEEGSSSWKEVKALETLLEERLAKLEPEPEPESEPEPVVETEYEFLLFGGTADHQHDLVVEADDLLRLHRGEEVWVTSTHVEGHNHQVLISSQQADEQWTYAIDTCKTGGVPSLELHKCQDGHAALSPESPAQ